MKFEVDEIIEYTRSELTQFCEQRQNNWLIEWNEYEPGIEDHALLNMREEHFSCQINYSLHNWSYLEKSTHRERILAQIGI